MRTMYDAVTASNIPRNAQMVAGYSDTIKIPQWTQADWNLFPNAVKVSIVKKASSNWGHVLDVEVGDATPAQAPGWVQARRVDGGDPTIYCNESTWPAVEQAFSNAGVARPHYWIAKYDGVASLPLAWINRGAVAKQYNDPGPYDLSIVMDFWPGVDGNDMSLTDDDVNKVVKGIFDATISKQNVPAGGAPTTTLRNNEAWRDALHIATNSHIDEVAGMVRDLANVVAGLSNPVVSLTEADRDEIATRVVEQLTTHKLAFE